MRSELSSIRGIFHHARRLAAAIAFFTALVFSPRAHAQPAPARPPAERERELDRLIDAVASRNRPPKLVQDVPDFPEGYDFKDQERVRAAIWALSQDDSNDLWERLAAHFGDQRYSVSFQSKGEGRSGCQLDVGVICQAVARGKFKCAYLRHLEPEKTYPYGPNAWLGFGGHTKDFIPESKHFHLHRPPQIGNVHDLAAWCLTRKGKPLYELQIEICEWAVKRVEGYDDVAEKPKKEFVAALQKEIESLNKSKRPVVDHSRWASPIADAFCKFYGSRESALKEQKFRAAHGGRPDYGDE
jgi:hypothetical protein